MLISTDFRSEKHKNSRGKLQNEKKIMRGACTAGQKTPKYLLSGARGVKSPRKEKKMRAKNQNCAFSERTRSRSHSAPRELPTSSLVPLESL